MRILISNTTRSIATLALGALLWVGVSTTAQAQQSLTYGLKGGLNVAHMYGDAIGDQEARVRFGGGAFLTYRMSEYFAIQPEVLLTVKGGDVTPGVIDEAGETTYELGYLEVPVLAKLYVPTDGRIQPNLFAGPVLDVKLAGEADGRDLDDALKETDFGLAFGGGLDFLLPVGRGLKTVTLDARYTLGLVEVFDVPGEPEARNGAFTVMLGLGL